MRLRTALVIVVLGVTIALAVLARIIRDEQSGLDPLLRVGVPLAAVGAGVLLLSVMLATFTRRARMRLVNLRKIAPKSEFFTVAGTPELESTVVAFGGATGEHAWPTFPTLEIAESGLSLWADGPAANRTVWCTFRGRRLEDWVPPRSKTMASGTVPSNFRPRAVRSRWSCHARAGEGSRQADAVSSACAMRSTLPTRATDDPGGRKCRFVGGLGLLAGRRDRGDQ